MVNPANDLDVIIVGAGISGINMAYRLQTKTPHLKYAIIESRPRMGGTWDLFKYPGIRSDSDLHTFGFAWRPWTGDNVIADAQSILSYIQDAAKEEHIDEKIWYDHKVQHFDWDSHRQKWRIDVLVNLLEKRTIHCRFLVLGMGYYDYNSPRTAIIPGLEDFRGKTVHPQFWPEDVDYRNKRVVIIGSGATAVTLLPKLSQLASSVIQLQRSPSYYRAVPAKDPIDSFIDRWTPHWLGRKMIRMKYILASYFFYQFCQYFPKLGRTLLQNRVERELPAEIPLDPHFTPQYNPWDQRLCYTPEGDFFTALRSGKAQVRTDVIKTVTKDTIILSSGEELFVDIIVTATGLRLQVAGGIGFSLDGKPVNLAEKMWWKGAMLQDLPNMAYCLGYTNASWTLGADATAFLVTRILQFMEKQHAGAIIPTLGPRKVEPIAPISFSSTYFQEAAGKMPLAGNKGNWKPRTDYLSDIWQVKYGNLKDGLQIVKRNPMVDSDEA